MKVRKRRFAEMARQNPVEKPAPGRCNYPLDGGMRFCRVSAGAATRHPGSGYCSRHDSAAYDPVHRYRRIKNSSLKKKLEHLDDIERDVYDMIPEIQLMRTLLMDYIDRFYEWQKKLHAWYESQGKSPKRMMDISEAAKLVESVGKLIERQQRMTTKESISLETFRRVTELMGIVVARHVKTGTILEAIERDWQMLDLESKTPVVPMADHPEPRKITDGSDDDA